MGIDKQSFCLVMISSAAPAPIEMESEIFRKNRRQWRCGCSEQSATLEAVLGVLNRLEENVLAQLAVLGTVTLCLLTLILIIATKSTMYTINSQGRRKSTQQLQSKLLQTSEQK